MRRLIAVCVMLVASVGLAFPPVVSNDVVVTRNLTLHNEQPRTPDAPYGILHFCDSVGEAAAIYKQDGGPLEIMTVDDRPILLYPNGGGGLVKVDGALDVTGDITLQGGYSVTELIVGLLDEIAALKARVAALEAK